MPTIDLFEGLKISVYGNDHNPPRFHANYAEYEIQVNIETLQILKGELPARQWRKLKEWAEQNQSRLAAEFKLRNPELR